MVIFDEDEVWHGGNAVFFRETLHFFGVDGEEYWGGRVGGIGAGYELKGLVHLDAGAGPCGLEVEDDEGCWWGGRESGVKFRDGGYLLDAHFGGVVLGSFW